MDFAEIEERHKVLFIVRQQFIILWRISRRHQVLNESNSAPLQTQNFWSLS